MSLSLQHLWCEVSGAATERLRKCVFLHAFFTEPKVGQQRMSIRVKYDIIRLQISKNNVSFV